MSEAISFRIDKERGVLVIRLTDDADAEDFLRRYRALLDSGEVDPSCRILTDLRALTSNPLEWEGLRGAAAISRDFRARLDADAPTPRTAIVVSSDLTFGFARQYTHMAQGNRSDIELFRDVAGACEWVGLDEAFLDAQE